MVNRQTAPSDICVPAFLCPAFKQKEIIFLLGVLKDKVAAVLGDRFQGIFPERHLLRLAYSQDLPVNGVVSWRSLSVVVEIAAIH